MSIATQKGDKGTTGLFYGGRVKKNSPRIECNGAVDEAQSALGYARALSNSEAGPLAGELDATIMGVERDLWVLMAEVATAPANRRKLTPGASLVSEDMVANLTAVVHDLEAREVMPAEFVVPGSGLVSAALDVARTVVRRAERLAVGVDLGDSSHVVPYLNRLSDACWLLARAVEKEHTTARTTPRSTARTTARIPARTKAPAVGKADAPDAPGSRRP